MLFAVLLALVSSCNAYTSGATFGRTAVRSSTLQMSSRREIMFAAAATATATTFTALPAFADANEDAIAAIAARAKAENEANAAKAAASFKTEEELIEETESAKRNIGLAVFASVALSVPFYFKNLQRLGTKIATGGKDDGRGGMPAQSKKDVGKAASQFFFKRGYEDN